MSIDSRPAPEMNISETLTKISHSVQEKIKNQDIPIDLEKDAYKPELPAYKKEIIEANRQKNSELKDSIIENVFSIGQSIKSDKDRYTSLQQKQNPTLDDQKEILRLQKNIERTDSSLDTIKAKSEAMYQLTKEILNNQNKDSMENYIDDKTGLYLISVVSENSCKRIENWIENNGLSPRGYKIIMTDMMLFHTANERLGPDGLDQRLFTCMQGEIAVSRYIDGERNLYSRMKESEIKDNKYIQKYFPVGSKARTKIDQLKEAGVQISPFRVNAGGGDEFGYTIEFTKEINYNDEAKYEQLSSDVISHVVESTSLSESESLGIIDESFKKRELTSDEILDRNEQYKCFYDSINNIRHKSRPERGIILTPQQIEENSFLDSLRVYFSEQHSNGLGQEILNPQANISMEYASINFSGNLPTLEDALMLTIYGKDSYLETHEHNKYGQLDEYTTDLAGRIKNILSPEDLKKPETIKKNIQNMIFSDSIKNIFHILNEEVNIKGKHDKKTNVFLSAVTGNIESIITVGASEQSGRQFYKPQSKEERKDTIQKIKEYYKEILTQKNLNPQLNQLRQDLENKKIEL